MFNIQYYFFFGLTMTILLVYSAMYSSDFSFITYAFICVMQRNIDTITENEKERVCVYLCLN